MRCSFNGAIVMAFAAGLLSTPVLGAEQDALATDIKVEIGKVSQVVFPERVIRVVKGGAPDSVLVEVMDTAVYLLPKADPVADVFVTTSSGKSYPLILHPSAERDIKIRIGMPLAGTGRRYAYADTMELMKDLLLGREPRMATPLGKKGELLMENAYLTLVIEAGYQVGSWRAYVLKVRNLTGQDLLIPVERISLPDLLAVSTDKDMLAPKGSEGEEALMYVIAGHS